MKKRIIRLQIIIVSTVILITGCAQLPAETEKSPVAGNEHNRRTALQCGSCVLKAFQEKRYELLKEALAENLQKEFSSEAFTQSLRQLQKTLGTIRSFEYWGELKTPVLKTPVWKVCFRRNGSDDSVIEQEVLFRALIAPVDGKNRVISFGFL